MPNSICDAKFASGFVRPSQNSEQNFVNCALSLDRTLVSCMGDPSWWLGFSGKKPFYHGSRPLPLPNVTKLLMFRGLAYRTFRFWGNSCLRWFFDPVVLICQT